MRAPRTMSDDEIRMALGALEEASPAWVAINQLLDRSLASAVLDASDPNLDPGKGTYPGGRVAALAEFKAALHDYHAAPIKPSSPTSAKTAPHPRRRRA